MADAPSSAGQPICIWSQASRNFEIHIEPEVIGRLGTESLVAFKRVPRRGLEIGGILLGRTEIGEDTTTFLIEGFQPIESEHRSGPSYVLSDSDFAALQTALTKNGTACLGVYRSQTRSDQLAIQNSDIELFERCFGPGDALFLMLAPLPGTGGFFYRADGKLRCVYEFALVSSLSSVTTRPGHTSSQMRIRPQSSPTTLVLSNAKHLDAQDAENALSLSGELSEPSSQVVPLSSEFGAGNITSKSGHSVGQNSGWKIGMFVLAVITLLVLTAGVFSDSFRHVLSPDRRGPQFLHLTVQREGPSLRLLWDRNSSTLRSASRAVLHIRDGDHQSDRDLTPSELSGGVLTYEPKSSEVTFRLEAYSTEPNAIGSIQVMFPESPIPQAPAPLPAPVAEATVEAKPSPPTASVPVKTARPMKPSRFAIENKIGDQIQLPRLTPSGGAEIGLLATREPSGSGNLDNSQRPSPIADRPNLSEPDPKPSVRESDALQSVRSPSVQEPSASPPDRKYAVRVSAEPLEGSWLGHFIGKVPILRRLRKDAKSVAPSPVYQAQPVPKVPDGEKLVRPLTIDVKVYVGESGTVTHAEVVEYGAPPNWALANASLTAARQWTFEPARVDDIGVSSEVLLHFIYYSP
jgi:hypothetical protein